MNQSESGTDASSLSRAASGGGAAPAPASDEPPIIAVDGLIKRFGDQVVLDGVDLSVNPGETLVVMGGSGSGKSTLLRLIIGSLVPDAGDVRLFGRSICHMDEEALNEVRKRFGILFQSGALFNSMTLAENVALPLQEHTTLDHSTIDIMVTIKLELVGLREHADKYPAQISGGMKKRAGLARALALDPQILFYDEPSAGLDPVTSAQIDQLIADLTNKLGVTSVVVTHEMDSAFRIADRMIMLDRGRVLMIDERQRFERLRDHPGDRLSELDDASKLIRQFLRGDAEGPITQRKSSTGYAEDLLGRPVTDRTEGPAVEATRVA